MLQQTQVKTVIPYFSRFLSRFKSIDDLAAASSNDVLKLWEGLGYYSRARHFHGAAKIVVSDYDSLIPSDYEVFRSLPGVGDYTAAAVQSIAFNQPYAAVDGNVKRVLSRLYEMTEPVNEAKAKPRFQNVADSLLASDRPGDFNQAMMELGALICSPTTPDCERCPVSSFCLARLNHSVGSFPRRLKRKAVPVHQISVGIVLKNNRMLITLREPKGLLGGLWEFPGGKAAPGEIARQACRREISEETGLDIDIEKPLTVIRHAYTHFKIVMSVFICRYKSGRVKLDGPVAHRWIRFDQLDRFPFPKANHKIFPELEKYMQAGSGSLHLRNQDQFPN